MGLDRTKLRRILSQEGVSPKTARRPSLSDREHIDEQYADVPRNEQGELLPTMRDLKKVKMVVVGPKGKYSDPVLNKEGERIFKEITGSAYFGGSKGTPRHHPALVWIAQNHPRLFTSGFQLIPVPGGVYEIREYDGMESLWTPQSVKWVKI
jgi:hypothetical protein